MTPICVCYRGQFYAVLTEDDAHLGARLQALGTDHPVTRFVAAMCLYADAIASHRCPGPYHDNDAERWARQKLVPADRLARLSATDAVAGTFFGVPTEQIRARRQDPDYLPAATSHWATPASGRWRMTIAPPPPRRRLSLERDGRCRVSVG